MDEKRDEQKEGGLDRRRFIGALGAAAAAGAFVVRGGGGAKADDTQAYYFLDSYGDVSQVDPAVIALGVYPPPLPPGHQPPGNGPAEARRPKRPGPVHSGRLAPDDSGGGDSCTGTPTYASSPTAPNILLIMVDQMRAPRWLPSSYGNPWDPSPGGWAGFTTTYLPEINFLYNHSFVFPNYFPAATRCSPSRATLLTGLYSQQTCMFKTLNPSDTHISPSLIPYAQNGFPTIADVLKQPLFGSSAVPYTPVWIGKWHVSDPPGEMTVPGSNGPQDYGFDPTYSIPRPNNGFYPLPSTGCPSPDGSRTRPTRAISWTERHFRRINLPTFPLRRPSPLVAPTLPHRRWSMAN